MKNKAIDQLSVFLAGQGLKSTRQRKNILAVFVAAGRHLSAEELTHLVKQTDAGIGYATVYRTMKLLAEAGLAHERRFEDGVTRFEYNAAEKHHDHLICTRCGKILEFENEKIEELQQVVARKKRFEVHSHKLELYGFCAACVTKGQEKR